ncbi:MAG TPA: O-antigen ligase family protein, partial [Candidatus Polarisedimenticolia bacterium]|nr:O-antigen ligase family protein [Candidatus Polarisedimenticolia bacterium]
MLSARTVPPVSGAPFWALMTFTLIQILAPQEYFKSLAPFRIGLIAAAAAAATFLLDRIARHGPATVASREIGIVCGLALWAAVTVPWSYWPGGSLSFLTGVYLKTLVIFWLLANVVSTRKRLKVIVWGLCLMAAPLAVLALRAYLSGEFVDSGAVRRIESYEAPLTHNPNDLALMLNLILPLTAALFLAERRIAVRAALLALGALDVLAIVVSFSRAGFLTLGATASIYSYRLLRRPERGWAIAALALALLCAPLLPAAYLQRLSTISNIEADPTGSAQARWADTLAAVKFVARHPIVGAGLGMDFLALNEIRGPAWKDVHNVYLEHAVDLGLPGLVLFILLFAGCVRAATEVRRRAAGVPDRHDLFCLAEGIQISLAGFAVAALFHPVAYHVYFYYVAGLALAIRHVHD